jgi:hypothetical protein
MPWISKDGNSRSQLSPSDYLGFARSRIKVNIRSVSYLERTGPTASFQQPSRRNSLCCITTTIVTHRTDITKSQLATLTADSGIGLHNLRSTLSRPLGFQLGAGNAPFFILH